MKKRVLFFTLVLVLINVNYVFAGYQICWQDKYTKTITCAKQVHIFRSTAETDMKSLKAKISPYRIWIKKVEKKK